MPDAAVTTITLRDPRPALGLAAVAWLAEAAAKAAELSGPGALVWIGLTPDAFVVHGVLAGRSASREVPFAEAARLDANLLLAAVLAVHRGLRQPRPGRPTRTPFARTAHSRRRYS